jgi:hypothetical protein
MRWSCKGCVDEWETACEYARKGFHLATTNKEWIDGRKHFFVIMVNNNGERVVE